MTDVDRTDPRLSAFLAARASDTGAMPTAGDVIGRLGGGRRMMPADRQALARRSPLDHVVLFAIMVTVGLVLILLVGAAMSGRRVLDSGVITYTSATHAWDGGLISRDLGLYSIASSGGKGRLIVPLTGGTRVDTETMHLIDNAVEIWPGSRWSPDGSQIAFRGIDFLAGIVVVDTDRGDLRKVADATPDRSIYSFAWSPDGTRIAYITPEAPGWPPNNDSNGRLYVADLMTNTVYELSPEASGSVAWSPDGTTIAFGRTRPETSLLVLINADGTGERTFRYGHAGQNTLGGIAWSPDGSKIALVQIWFGLEASEGDFLMVVNPDGIEPRELARWPLEGCCVFGSVGGSLEWSPDGSWIATQRWDKVVLTAANGSGAEVSIDARWFDWSPDGSHLVIAAPGAQIEGSPYRMSAVYVADADGSNRRWLADGDHPQWSP